MSSNRIEGYARGLFEIARAEGTLDVVEDELFRFARAYESSDSLRNALIDEQIPPAKRQAIVEDLLGGKVNSTTTQLISMVVGSGRGRDLPAIVDNLVARASTAKHQEVAEVRSAVALTADQQARLATAISAKTGHEVTIRNIVDPTVVGGVVTRVGDELRAEVARLSAAAVDHVVTGSLDDATHQELIENFINRVGASA